MRNYYQILEVPQDASQEIIKEQYRFLVQAWHPDRFSSSAQKMKAEEKIKEINAAYEILRDPIKRAEYDRLSSSKRTSASYETDNEAKRRADQERIKREEEEKLRRKAEQERDFFRQYADEAHRQREQAKSRADKERQRREEAEKLHQRSEPGFSGINVKQDSNSVKILIAFFALVIMTLLFITFSSSLNTSTIMTQPVLARTVTLQASHQIAELTSTTINAPTNIPPTLSPTSTQSIIFRDDFHNSKSTHENWSSLGGTWVIEDGVLSCISNGKYLANITLPEDFTFQLDIMGVNVIDKIIVFRVIDDSEHYGLNFRTTPYNDVVLVKSLPGNEAQIIQSVPYNNNNNTWYALKVDVENNHIKVFVNGQQTIDFIDTSSPITGGTVGVGAMLQPGFSVVYYDNIVISHR